MPPAPTSVVDGGIGRDVDVELPVVARDLLHHGLSSADAPLTPHASRVVLEITEREAVTETLNDITRTKPSAWWIENLEKEKIGCGPINELSDVFEDPQVQAREMVIEMDHPATGGRPAKLIASPIKMSGTPVSYRQSPPTLGQHTEELLGEYLDMDSAAVEDLRSRGVV